MNPVPTAADFQKQINELKNKKLCQEQNQKLIDEQEAEKRLTDLDVYSKIEQRLISEFKNVHENWIGFRFDVPHLNKASVDLVVASLTCVRRRFPGFQIELGNYVMEPFGTFLSFKLDNDKPKSAREWMLC